MNVLLADALSESVVARLVAAGCTIENRPTLKGDELTVALAELKPKVLVVRSTKVTEADMSAAPSLELIVRAGAGYDTIDVSAASGLGIFVANCPGKNACAVAELTIGLLLALDRSIPDNVSMARAGQWNKAGFSEAQGLKGRTLGVIGTGNIGREVIRRAKALDMDIVAWSRSLTPAAAAELGVRHAASPAEVARQSDAVTLHVASAAGTAGLADRDFFAAMRPGAFFINTTRASVVDEAALLEAMETKGIRAGLDVFSNEPAGKGGPFEHPLAAHPSVYLTHHIGASTEQAQEAIAMEAARIIVSYVATGEVANCVNLATKTPATHQLTVRHLDKVGVLARVFNEISVANWNVHEMENVVFEEARAACAYIRFDGFQDNSVVDRIASQPDILAVSLIEL
ncbi:MAG: 3-phosphoglycerate dehydrogenase family protein [Bacteroidetes bacterium]|nr:3-phosphoglycerate dehydrogenase family protein [Bacteroidota bacterium]